jgi:phosphoribosylformylglycinamidine synthase
MTEPRVLVLRAPGTNCDEETAYAFNKAGARAEIQHINRVLESPTALDSFQMLCIPGGFSYGDDIAAGRILGNQICHHLIDSIKKFRDDGKLILGICNGFQVLAKSGVLWDTTDDANSNGGNGQVSAQATLAWNDSGRFEDRWVQLSVIGERSEFLRGVESMYLPVAHAEGKFVARDGATLDQLVDDGKLVLRYDSTNGRSNGGDVAYPENPNGSELAVAGMSDATGRVLGLMPHPERYIDRTQHPRWTRGEGSDPGDGLRLFENAVQFFQ